MTKYAAVAMVAAALGASSARGQIIPIPVREPVVGGVKLSAEGVVSAKETVKAVTVTQAEKDPPLGYVSLPVLFQSLKEIHSNKKPMHPEVRHPGLLTRIDYVLVFPAERDLVIVGPAETQVPAEQAGALHVVGKSGRPLLHIDDLVVALRKAHSKGGAWRYGCSLDSPGGADAQRRSDEVARKFTTSTPRATIIQEMQKAIGPQKVTLFGVPETSRLGFAMVAADYRLKRVTMGLDTFPGVSAAVDGNKPASSRFWFEPKYELQVSEDGLAYALKGDRLELKYGMQLFKDAGGDEPSKKLAAAVNKNMALICQTTPVMAELQNAADVGVVATLIHGEKLAEKAGWDMGWVLGDAYEPQKLPVPKEAETQVNILGGAVASGGVTFSPGQVVAEKKTSAVKVERKRPADGWVVREK